MNPILKDVPLQIETVRRILRAPHPARDGNLILQVL